MSTTEELRKALQALVNDIEGMANPNDIYELGYSDDNESDHMPKDFFGPFSCYLEADPRPGEAPFLCEGKVGTITVEWPNLRISLETAKALLAKEPV